MGLIRREGWPELLMRFIRDARHRPFVWGEWDCFLFASAAVQVLTGADPAASWRGKYHDERGAEACLAAAGGLTMVWTEALGPFPILPAFAQRGDIALVSVDGSAPTSAVVLGRRAAVVTPRGLAQIDLLPHTMTAWRV